MDDSFISYVQQLEVMAFFSGYPLLYFFIQTIAGKKSERNMFKNNMVSLLPKTYATVALLYFGLLLRNLYPDITPEKFVAETDNAFLVYWGIGAALFWLPLLNKRPILSLFHSLVFFFILLKEMYKVLTGINADKTVLKNEMKVYFDSLLLLGSIYLIFLMISFLVTRLRKNRV